MQIKAKVGDERKVDGEDQVCIKVTEHSEIWTADASSYAHYHTYEDWSNLTEKDLLWKIATGKKPRITGRIDL